MARLNGESLKYIFTKIEIDGTDKETVGAYFNLKSNSIGNYFAAKNHYIKGEKVNGRNISKKAFTEWAVNYGGKGEPVYMPDLNPGRKHVKKQSEQTVMNTNAKRVCPIMSSHDGIRYCTANCAWADAYAETNAEGSKHVFVRCEIENISVNLSGIADALQCIALDKQDEGGS